MWETLVPVAVGGAIGVAGALIPDWLRAKRERRVVEGCLKAEINALLSIVKRRRYIEELTALLDEIGKDADPASWRFYFSVRQNPFRVYESNLDRLGLLQKEFAVSVAQFYVNGRAILEDIQDMRDSFPPSKEQSVNRLKDTLALFKDTVELGEKLSEWPK